MPGNIYVVNAQEYPTMTLLDMSIPLFEVPVQGNTPSEWYLPSDREVNYIICRWQKSM